MRKAIIAAIVATALFAVGAFAASFTVQSEDIASGANAVSACATNVEITFDDAPTQQVGGTWVVDSAKATFYVDDGDDADDLPDLAVACDPFLADLSLDLTPVTAGGATTAAVLRNAQISDTAEATFNLTSLPGGAPTADRIVGASVLVDGTFLAPPN